MTTTVIVQAHCADTKEVKVTIADVDGTVEEFALQDGEADQRVVFDDREIIIKEVQK